MPQKFIPLSAAAAACFALTSCETLYFVPGVGLAASVASDISGQTANTQREQEAWMAQHAVAYAESDRQQAASVNMSLNEYLMHKQAMQQELAATGTMTNSMAEFKRRAYITSSKRRKAG